MGRRILRWSDLGYVFSALIGALLALALPTGAFVICSDPDVGSVTDQIGLVVAVVSALASIAIAVVAHTLNRTLQNASDRRSLTSSRAFSKIAIAEIRHQRATSLALNGTLRRFLDGEVVYLTLQSAFQHAPWTEPSATLFQSPSIGDLPDDIAQGLAEVLSSFMVASAVSRMNVTGLPREGEVRVGDLNENEVGSLRTLQEHISAHWALTGKVWLSFQDYLEKSKPL